jgi:hypothetical protein
VGRRNPKIFQIGQIFERRQSLQRTDHAPTATNHHLYSSSTGDSSPDSNTHGITDYQANHFTSGN